MISTLNKISKKIRNIIVGFSRKYSWFPAIYKSFWFYKFKASNGNDSQIYVEQYFAAKPNYGAGIGHQLANWIAGYWFAKQFGLSFAHIPFSTEAWDSFLGFGNLEKKVNDLKREGYKLVRLPLFDEDKQSEIIRVKRIINSYVGKKVVFVCEQDQFYRDQFGVIEEIQQKFYNATSRNEDSLQFDTSTYNVAIHIRRGDIVAGQNKIKNHTMRWMTNDYFLNALQNTLNYITTDKKVNIYLFSQGKKEDFIEFERFTNLNYCLDMSAIESFLHMVYADVLITSKSSFSYKPALLNRGLKIVPANFWHGYPNTKDWIKVSDEGELLTLKT